MPRYTTDYKADEYDRYLSPEFREELDGWVEDAAEDLRVSIPVHRKLTAEDIRRADDRAAKLRQEFHEICKLFPVRR